MRNCIYAVSYAIVLLGLDLSFSLGQETESPSPDGAAAAQSSASTAELDAIRAESQAFVAAFNNGDAKAIAALWTEDGDYIDESGQSFSGREAIEQAYAAFFAENPNVEIRIVVDSMRLLSDSAAIEDGHSIVDPAPVGAPAVGKYLAVHVKVNGKWLMSTVRDSRIETISSYSNVADLEFLIGTWMAEEHGAKAESVCRWVANKSFVQRDHTVTHPDGTTTSGVQLIGWNPQEGHIQSWDFSSDGGHAVGVWSPHDGGWTAEVHGMTGAGTPTSAIVHLTRLDDNAYAWQSVQRTADGLALPDTDEVVLKRRTTDR